MPYDQSGNWVDDFNDYFKKNPNATEQELYQKFPKLGGKEDNIVAALGYDQDKGKLNESDLYTKYPQFDERVKPGQIKENQTPEPPPVDYVGKAKQDLQNHIATHGLDSIDKITQQNNLNQLYQSQQGAVAGQDATYNKINIPDFRPKQKLDDDRQGYLQQMKTDPEATKKVVSQIMHDNPDIAPKVAGDAFMASRQGGDINQQLDTKKKIESGENLFNPITNRVIKPLDMGESIVHGWRERQKSLAGYDFLKNSSDEDIIKAENDRRASANPDVATPTPYSMGALTAPIGSESVPMAKSIIAGSAVGMIPGAEEFAPAAAAAASAPEYWKRSYNDTFHKRYDELKGQGKTDQEALGKARDDAQYAAEMSVVQAGAMTAGAQRLGMGNIEINPSLKSAVARNIDYLGKFGKDALKEGALNFTIGAGAQTAQNVQEGKNTMDNALEAGSGQAVTMGALGLLMKGAHEASKIPQKAIKEIRQGLIKQPELVQQHLSDGVQDGTIAPQDATKIANDLATQKEVDQKVDPKVTDDETRVKLQDKITKVEDLKTKLKNAIDAVKPSIKDKIEKANEDILNLTQEGKQKSKDAVQESGTGEILQRQPEEAGETGGERDGVEPVVEGQKAPGESIKVRHAESEEDAAGIISGGKSKTPLTENGKQQASDLADDLSDHGINKIVSPETTRNKQTADIVSDKLGAPVETHPNLHSWDVGVFTKMPDEHFEEVKDFFVNHPDEKEYKGEKLGESFNEYKDRVTKAMSEIPEDPHTLIVQPSNNIMLEDAIRNNGGWNDAAKKQYLTAESPRMAELLENKPQEVTGDTPEETEALKNHGEEAAKQAVDEVKSMPLEDLKNLVENARKTTRGSKASRNSKPANTESELLPTVREGDQTGGSTKGNEPLPADEGSQHNVPEVSKEPGGEAVPRTVSAAFAGGRIRGEVVKEEAGRTWIKSKDGTVYPVENKHILKEGENVLEHYDSKAKIKEGIKEALPKLGEKTETQERKTPKQYSDPLKALDAVRQEHPNDKLLNRAADFLEPILKKNPNVKIEDADLGGRTLGLSHPDGRVQVDFAAHPNTETAHATMLHELIHAATRNEIDNNPAFRTELEGLLDKIRGKLDLPLGNMGDTLISPFVYSGKIPGEKYGASNAHELLAEVFSNSKFNDLLKDIKVGGDNMLHKIYKTIVNALNKHFGILGNLKEKLNSSDMAEYLMKLTEKTVKADEKFRAKGEALKKIGENEEEEQVKKVIKNISVDLDDKEVKKTIMEATGWDEARVERLMRESGYQDKKLASDVSKMIDTRTPEQIHEYLSRKGVDPDRAAAILGEAEKNLIKPAEKEKYLKQVQDRYFKREDEWLGNKDVNRINSREEAREFQNQIKKSSKGQNANDVDKAIHIYLDTQRNPEHFEKYYDKLTPEQKRIARMSQNLTPEQKQIASNISEEYKKMGQLSQNEGIIKDMVDSYVARAWDFSKKSSTEQSFKFNTGTKHSLERTLETILQGQAEGLKLKIEGATNNLQILKEEIGNVIENKRLIDDALHMKYDTGVDAGNGKTVKENLFSTKQIDGYKRIDSPFFKKWEYQGKLSDYSSEEAEAFGRHKDTMISENGSVLKKSDVYAPEDVAKSLNNILGHSKLSDNNLIQGITKFNSAVKQSILSYSGYHFIAFTRAHELSGKDMGLAGVSPRIAYKRGIQELADQHPIGQDLIKHGMTLNRMQDFKEGVNDHNTWLGKQLDKNKFTSAAKNKMIDLNTKFHRYLFESYGAGLKMFDGINLAKSELAKGKDYETTMKGVAKIMNDTYGGINWDRMRGTRMQDPTMRHLSSLLFLAPDWTASNLRFAKKAFDSGNEGTLYRKAWGRVLLRGAALTALASAGSAAMDTQDGEDTWDAVKRHYSEAWKVGLGKSGHNYGGALLRAASIDISPFYHWIGGNPKSSAYFSVFGAYFDPVKMLATPGDFLEAKLAFIPKTGFEAMTSQNWQGKEFTTLDELLGMDDKGTYKFNSESHKAGDVKNYITGEKYTKDEAGHAEGDNKGGKLKGQLVKYASGGSHPLEWNELPSFVGSQVRGMMPTGIQSMFQKGEGESDWAQSVLQAPGTGISVVKKPK